MAFHSPSRTTSMARLSGISVAVVNWTRFALSAIFVWLNPGVRLNLILAAGVPLAGMLLWMGYQLLFLVFSGATPGMRLVHLRLIGFNGSPAHLRLRTWRVLASFLSVFAIGLGYVWSLLDENGLCWHDRITRTCIVGR